MNRVYCLYCVSDRGQVEKNDIPMQRIACQTFAREREWKIVREFSEKGVSGYKLTMQQAGCHSGDSGGRPCREIRHSAGLYV